MVDFLDKHGCSFFIAVTVLIVGYGILLEQNPVLAQLLIKIILLLVLSFLFYLDIKKRGPIHRLFSRVICSFKGHDLGSPKYSFLSAELCKKESICNRCASQVKEEIRHQISGAKTYFQPDGMKCNRMSDCKNCSKPILLGTQEHEVSAAKIYFEISKKGDQCERMSNCTNCGTPVKLGIQSHEEQRVESPCETAMKCQNCGRKRILEDRHQYKFVSSRQAGPRVYDGIVGEWVCNYEEEYKCEVCGNTKIELDRWDERPDHLQGVKEMTGLG